MDFFSGENFMKLCEICIISKKIRKLYNIDKEFLFIEDKEEDIKRKIKDKVLIFVKTDYLPFFEKRVLKYIENKFTLITHNSDISPNMENILNSDKLLYWYGTNIKRTEKSKAIPIGLENSYFGRTDFEYIKEKSVNPKANGIYLNFNTKTNRKRLEYYNFLKEEGYIFNEKKEWKEYIDELSTYKYCFCPEGNGLDTHRVWECIYLGVTPICIKNILYESFKEFPIVWINDINEIKSFL